MKKPIALIDMDGTIANYDKALIRDLKKISTEQEIEIIDSCEGKIWKMCDDNPVFEQRRHIITSQSGWWLNLEPITMNLLFVEHLYHIGYDIHILTKGPMSKPNAWTEKLLWAQNHIVNVPFSMNIVSDKSLFYGKLLFDDHFPYVEKWLNHRPRGFVVMPQTPTNREFKHAQVIHLEDNLYSYNTCLDKVENLISKREVEDNIE